MNLFDEDNNQHIISIGSIEGELPEPTTAYNTEDLPLLPTRNLVLFPGVAIPLRLVRDSALHTAQEAKRLNIPIGIVCQKDPEVENPGIEDVEKYGVIADILQVIALPDNSHTAIVRARDKFRITGRGFGISLPGAELSARVRVVNEIAPRDNDDEFNAIVKSIRETASEIAGMLNEGGVPSELQLNLMKEQDNEVILVNTIATHIPIDIKSKMGLLAQYRIKERARMLYVEIVKQEEMMKLSRNVHERAREAFDQEQRRAFLQRQMDAINHELNGDEEDYDRLRARFESLSPALSAEAKTHISKELAKLNRLNPMSPDYSVQVTYLETVLDLPWDSEVTELPEITHARKVLDEDHYGLKDIKERILEQIALYVINEKDKIKMQSPILCFVGPPGIGKTSLGASIARAMGRPFQRVSLGGLHDESEIRGHRRTYIGALPGRIISALQKASKLNPVIMLDEIDKIGADYKGDPSAALLEVLDPEQNSRFHDNYIDVDFDLSKVMFIATANTLNGVPPALIDRMEIIELSGYSTQEKIEIARKHLIPKIGMKLGTKPQLTDEALLYVIDHYTSESGVRQLEKRLSALSRKMTLKRVENGLEQTSDSELTVEDVKRMLGVERYTKDRYEGNDFIGVVTGLAWTAHGGEILSIETSLSPGKGEKLTLTGNLGDVMKESAMIARQYVRSHAADLGIDPEMFEKNDIHIHVPEGAIPKDGPSAGITMATSIASAFTGRKVKPRLAMTGEITLRGKVMPVGGIKEKILAAVRAGITEIALSEENRRDIEDIDPQYRRDVTFHYIRTVADLFPIALEP